MESEWADRRQEGRAGICFERKVEGQEKRGERDQSRGEENRDGGKEGRDAEEIRQENCQDDKTGSCRMTGNCRTTGKL